MVQVMLCDVKTELLKVPVETCRCTVCRLGCKRAECALIGVTVNSGKWHSGRK